MLARRMAKNCVLSLSKGALRQAVKKIGLTGGNVRRQLRERDRFPSMSARGRFLSGLVTVVVAFVGFVTVGALPAAANSATIQYVALGDSYAAGQGAPPYLNECLQSDQGYPALLDSEQRIHLRANEACTGATTDDVTDSQLAALNRGTRLVTLTVGAADLGLSAVLAACTTGTQAQCLEAIGAAVGGDALVQLGIDLRNLYAEVAEAAPRARIVVTGYPHLFASDAPIDPLIRDAINSAIDALNATIEAAVDAQPAEVDIVYVDVVRAFGEHGIGGELPPFINPPGPNAEAFHPTAAGYVAYAAAISAALPAEWLEEQAQLA
jgi:lysophospholipase L1-like esterase